MSVHRGRIVRAGHPMTALTIACAQTEPATPEAATRLPRGRVVDRERVEAARASALVLEQAREQATRIVEQARAEGARIVEQARAEGLERASSELAGAWLSLHRREADEDRAALDRGVELGRLMAERLIGESLRLEPSTIALLAREAMHQLWRARAVVIHAHPSDTAALQDHLATFGMPPERLRIEPDPELKPGNLRFRSELGELDADLAPQLDRLAEALRRELGAS